MKNVREDDHISRFVDTRVGVYGYCSNTTEANCGISRLAAVGKYRKTVTVKSDSHGPYGN